MNELMCKLFNIPFSCDHICPTADDCLYCSIYYKYIKTMKPNFIENVLNYDKNKR